MLLFIVWPANPLLYKRKLVTSICETDITRRKQKYFLVFNLNMKTASISCIFIFFSGFFETFAFLI